MMFFRYNNNRYDNLIPGPILPSQSIAMYSVSFRWIYFLHCDLVVLDVCSYPCRQFGLTQELQGAIEAV